VCSGAKKGPSLRSRSLTHGVHWAAE